VLVLRIMFYIRRWQSEDERQEGQGNGQRHGRKAQRGAPLEELQHLVVYIALVMVVCVGTTWRSDVTLPTMVMLSRFSLSYRCGFDRVDQASVSADPIPDTRALER
jgi:hypothetical protein